MKGGKRKMKAKFVDDVGCIVEGDFSRKELNEFMTDENTFNCVWYFDEELNSYRYPLTSKKGIIELQKCKFEEVSKAGGKSCITDLFINAGY